MKRCQYPPQVRMASASFASLVSPTHAKSYPDPVFSGVYDIHHVATGTLRHANMLWDSLPLPTRDDKRSDEMGAKRTNPDAFAANGQRHVRWVEVFLPRLWQVCSRPILMSL